MQIAGICLLLFLTFCSVNCSKIYVIDTSLNVTVEEFKCLKESYSVFIARIWNAKGQLDLDGIRNIKNAREAGFENIQGYFFPRAYDGLMSAAYQMETALNGLDEHGVEIDRLWIDIQNDDNEYWLTDKVQNQNFILELIHLAEERIPKVGIYANNNAWESVVGTDWKGVSNKLLWYPFFDIQPV
uniref:Lysozyme n=1 Tax=Panagrolaimus sp. ES5 TaxID=591445 RepID=A0AC34GCS5_9BILA